jgi:hypothetical protein
MSLAESAPDVQRVNLAFLVKGTIRQRETSRCLFLPTKPGLGERGSKSANGSEDGLREEVEAPLEPGYFRSSGA